MTLSVIFYPYHFARAILSIPFCPMPFCPYTILSIPFCPLPFCPVTEYKVISLTISHITHFNPPNTHTSVFHDPTTSFNPILIHSNNYSALLSPRHSSFPIAP